MELLEGRKYAPACLGHVLVLGLGKSGKAASEYLLGLIGDRVESLSIAAGALTPEAESWAESARARGAVVLFDHETIERHYDLCIASPGISQLSAFYQSAAKACDEVISEVEFAWRESAAKSKWIAITGTNGKTTTTALCAHLLKMAGAEAAAVGNIGDTCIEAVASGSVKYYVAEVSSYQLASTSRFAPDVAVVLNVTPDHLVWHGDFTRYVEAKWKVLDSLTEAPFGVAVLNACDEVIRSRIKEIRAQGGFPFAYVPIGGAAGLGVDMRRACGSENAAFRASDGYLHVAMGSISVDLASIDDLLLKGEHNQINAIAAAAAALAVGATASSLTEGLLTFAPLPHRIEPAGTVAGVECYNDSKATNVDSVLVALTAFGDKKPIVLLGGRDKGTDLAPLVASCKDHAKAVVCFGEAADRFHDAFGAAGFEPLYAAGTMEEALDAALAVAQAGDVVLLSPACASFDEFSCFEERGDVFKHLVAIRSERAGVR